MLRLSIALLLLSSSLALVACSAADAEAVDDTSEDLSSKKAADLSAFAGTNWTSTSAAADDGDVVALRLFADGTYVRLRCYGKACAEAVPETDRFTAFTSKGKTYLELWSFERVAVPAPATKGGAKPPPGAPPKGGAAPATTWEDKPVVADTYEIKKSGAGMKLRKTYSKRWTSLAAIGDVALCGDTGGTWTIPPSLPKGAPYCTCPTKGDGYVAPIGCMHIAVSTESACDDTNGSYTDDDATKLGTYCQCGIGRTMTDTGCVDL